MRSTDRLLVGIARIEALARDELKLNYDLVDRSAGSEVERALIATDPVRALARRGYEVEFLPRILMDARFGGGAREFSGLLDPQAQRVSISAAFGARHARFTAAHELGHLVLDGGHVQFRDVPSDTRDGNTNNPVERDANDFAACFLMPRRLVARVFAGHFGSSEPLVIDERLACLVAPDDPHRLLYDAEKFEIAQALAKYRPIGRVDALSIADVFKVSVAAMAKRIAELDLFRFP